MVKVLYENVNFVILVDLVAKCAMDELLTMTTPCIYKLAFLRN